jgi:hypothetical protein
VCFPTRVQDGVEFKGAMPGPGGKIGVSPRCLWLAGGLVVVAQAAEDERENCSCAKIYGGVGGGL